MRKLLLAGVAVVGSLGYANAQTTTTTTTTTAAPLPMSNLGYPSQPSSYLGGNNGINQDGGPPSAGPQNPTPGSMVIHLNGRVWAYAGFGGGSGYINNITTTTTTTTPTSVAQKFIPWATAKSEDLYANSNYTLLHHSGTVVNGVPGGVWSVVTPGSTSTTTKTTTAKLNPMQFIGYFRLYPGVDAMATNGLRYGAIVEIRQNFIGQGYGSTTAGLQGAGANYGASPSGSSSASTLYVRREAVYLGSNSLGIVRIGQDDGPFSQFDNGVTTFQYGSGAWNGDGPDNIPGNAQPTFPFWSGIGAEYTPSKAVYFSPRFAGFDFAVSYAPNNGPNNASACAVAEPGCVALSSSPTTTFGGADRPTNWVEAMARYQGTFGGFGIYAIAGYSASGNVKSTAAGSQQYQGFSVGDFGLTLSYAGFSVGGNVLGGAYNNQVQLQPKGGVQAIAWLGGVAYVNGPYQAYASYYNYQYQGAGPGPGIGQRYDDAAFVGAQYAIAPGLNAYAEYLYGQSHQGGVNLLNGGTDTSVNNNVHIQSFIIGTRVQW